VRRADGTFDAISLGRASVVTDNIVEFTERGILLKSARSSSDIIITATGLDLLALGG